MKQKKKKTKTIFFVFNSKFQLKAQELRVKNKSTASALLVNDAS